MPSVLPGRHLGPQGRTRLTHGDNQMPLRWPRRLDAAPLTVPENPDERADHERSSTEQPGCNVCFRARRRGWGGRWHDLRKR
jgi:hypothetical protein